MDVLITSRPVLAPLLLALVLYGAILSFFRLSFQDCDDVLLLLLSKGVGLTGSPEPMNTRLNIGLSLVLTRLYQWFPAVAWYAWMHVITNFLSLWGVVLAVSALRSNRAFKVGLLVLSGGVYGYLCTFLHWTVTASLAGTASTLLFLTAYQAGASRPRTPCFLAAILAILSASIRSSSFLLILLLAAPSAYLLFRRSEAGPGRRTVMVFALAAWGLAAAGTTVDGLYYRSKPEWAEAMRFGRAYFDLAEVRAPVYDASAKAVFDRAGWTEADFHLLMDWYYLDPDTYSPEKLRSIARHFPRFKPDKREGETFKEMFGNRTARTVLLSCLVLLLLVPRRRLRWALLETAWTAAVLVFLWLAFKIPERVYLPCIFLLMNLILLRVVPAGGEEGTRTEPPYRKAVVASLWVILFAVNVHFLAWWKGHNTEWARSQRDFTAFLSGFQPEKDKLYVLWDSVFPLEWIPPFDGHEIFRDRDLVSLTWFQRTPVTRRMLEKHGVKDLFRDMVDHPGIRLVCSEREGRLYQWKVMEKYGVKTALNLVASSRFFPVYEVKSVP